VHTEVALQCVVDGNAWPNRHIQRYRGQPEGFPLTKLYGALVASIPKFCRGYPHLDRSKFV